jgi:hypothetical protein
VSKARAAWQEATKRLSAFLIHSPTVCVKTRLSYWGHRPPQSSNTGIEDYLVEKRTVPFLSASVFPAPEYCRNTLENIEGKMDQTSGLCEYRQSLLQPPTGPWRRLEIDCSLTTLILSLNFDCLLIIVILTHRDCSGNNNISGAESAFHPVIEKIGRGTGGHGRHR